MSMYKITIQTDRFGSRRCVSVTADTLVQAVGQIQLYKGELLVGCEVIT